MTSRERQLEADLAAVWERKRELDEVEVSLRARVSDLRTAIGAVLDAVDYTAGACAAAAMVAAVLPVGVLKAARTVMLATGSEAPVAVIEASLVQPIEDAAGEGATGVIVETSESFPEPPPPPAVTSSAQEIKLAVPTMGDLAELVERVRSGDESAMMSLTCGDLGLVEWICNLLPAATIDAMRASAGSPLWGPGAPEPNDLSKDGVAVKPKTMNDITDDMILSVMDLNKTMRFADIRAKHAASNAGAALDFRQVDRSLQRLRKSGRAEYLRAGRDGMAGWRKIDPKSSPSTGGRGKTTKRAK